MNCGYVDFNLLILYFRNDNDEDIFEGLEIDAETKINAETKIDAETKINAETNIDAETEIDAKKKMDAKKKFAAETKRELISFIKVAYLIASINQLFE